MPNFSFLVQSCLSFTYFSPYSLILFQIFCPGMNTSNWIGSWFIDLLMFNKLHKIALKRLFWAFFDKAPPLWKPIFKIKKVKLVQFHYMC